MPIEIKRGDTVRWEEGEGTVHQVIADKAQIDIGYEHYDVEGSDPALLIHHGNKGYTLKYLSEVERVDSAQEA